MSDESPHPQTPSPLRKEVASSLPIRSGGRFRGGFLHQCLFPTVGLLLFLILSACTPPSTSSISITATPEPRTTWGDIIPLGQAPYAPAPSVLAYDGEILTSWIGADDERVFQGFRRWQDDTLDSTVIPVLDVSAPFAQSIYPADNDGYHLLWMDIEARTERIQLFSAYLDNTLTTLIAPPSFVSEQVTHYTAIPDIEGALWVVWSGGLLAEPALYHVRIDGLGRPMFPERLRLDGDYPVFAQTLDNRTYLFWISQVNRAVLRGEFVDGELTRCPRYQSIARSI